ncbi:MAG TPA: hypothetical protein VK838_01580 [Candidatus Limnocylindrales bacterium]|nr:hypothetical protein [Candidatus Limnocylindrales bacterium]
MARRWRARHDARRETGTGDRPPADEERQARARAAFPYRDVPPAAYADQHGREMIGYTYDEFTYDDPELDAWLGELGRILRERRAGTDG